MTDKEYLRRMRFLLDELDRISTAEPYDKDEHSSIVDAINHVHCQRQAAWGACPRFISLFFWIMLFVLALLAIASFVCCETDAPITAIAKSQSEMTFKDPSP